MSRRKRRASQDPPIAPQPIHPLRRLLRRLLMLLAVFVILVGPIMVARLRNHDARVRILNQSALPVTGVELDWNGGKKKWDEIAPGASAVVVLPERAVQSVRLRFLGPDGGFNRLLHAGRPPGRFARLVLSRRIDFLIRDDPLHPGSISSTVSRPGDLDYRELLGLGD